MPTPANAPYKLAQRITLRARYVFRDNGRQYVNPRRATKPHGKSAVRAAKRARRLARAA